MLVGSVIRGYVVMCGGLELVFFFQAEDGIRDLVRSRGLGDVYKRQATSRPRMSILSQRARNIILKTHKIINIRPCAALWSRA